MKDFNTAIKECADLCERNPFNTTFRNMLISYLNEKVKFLENENEKTNELKEINQNLEKEVLTLVERYANNELEKLKNENVQLIKEFEKLKNTKKYLINANWLKTFENMKIEIEQLKIKNKLFQENYKAC